MTATAFDLIVVGEGVAGLACARRAAQHGMRCATFEGTVFGGLILNVNELDPAPNDTPCGGAEYASAIVEVNADLGVQSHMATVSAVRRASNGFEVVADDIVFRAAQVVIASGAARRLLGVPGENALTGRGVSQCADCDGPLYRGQDVVVVGGGDSALQEALALAQYCRTVFLVHRRDAFRAHPRFVERLSSAPAIEPLWQCEVTQINGTDGVTGVTLRDVISGSRREVPCAAVFAYVGLTPSTGFLSPDVDRGVEGHLVTGADRMTSQRGLYAIGAVRDHFGGTIDDALHDGEIAAETAAAFIAARAS